jgi:hypothetical protein
MSPAPRASSRMSATSGTGSPRVKLRASAVAPRPRSAMLAGHPTGRLLASKRSSPSARPAAASRPTIWVGQRGMRLA